MKNKIYIRGNKERGKEVIAELEKRGGTLERTSHRTYENWLYFIDDDGMINSFFANSFNGLLIQDACKEIKLPKQKCHFEPFDKVVVRVGECAWTNDLFSYYKEGHFPYRCIGGCITNAYHIMKKREN